MNPYHWLTFSMQFDRDRGLDHGRLTLNAEGRTKEVWVATTSTANRQKPEDFHGKGGQIPPQYRVPGLKCWRVATKPIPMANKPGIMGNFYKIDPHIVTTDKGGVRGDFGIHKDDPQNGTLGCLGLRADRFADFEGEMAKLSQEGIAWVDLFVQYS